MQRSVDIVMAALTNDISKTLSSLGPIGVVAVVHTVRSSAKHCENFFCAPVIPKHRVDTVTAAVTTFKKNHYKNSYTLGNIGQVIALSA